MTFAQTYQATQHKVTERLPVDSTLCGSMESLAVEIVEFYFLVL